MSLSLDQTTANVSSALAAVSSNRAALASAQAQLEAKKADRIKAESDVKLQQVLMGKRSPTSSSVRKQTHDIV